MLTKTACLFAACFQLSGHENCTCGKPRMFLMRRVYYITSVKD